MEFQLLLNSRQAISGNLSIAYYVFEYENQKARKVS
jgi:hypothetical protein